MFEKLIALLGALVCLQFPQFYLQYMHELKGHILELKHQVSLFEQAARISGKSLTEWITKFIYNEDPDIALQGKLLQDMVERLNSFQYAANSLETSSFIEKPFQFLRLADSSIIYDTWQTFHWGIEFSMDSLGYAGMGLILGYIFSKILYLAFSKVKQCKFLSIRI